MAVSYPTPALKDRFLILGVLFDLHLGSTGAIDFWNATKTPQPTGWSLLYVFFTWSIWQIWSSAYNQFPFKKKNTQIFHRKVRRCARTWWRPGKDQMHTLEAAGHGQQLGSNFFSGHGPPCESRWLWLWCQLAAKLSGHSLIINHANPKCICIYCIYILSMLEHLCKYPQILYDQMILHLTDKTVVVAATATNVVKPRRQA